VKRFYPSSFLRLILIGFVLVALPLVVAVASSIVTIEQLAHQSLLAASAASVQARSGREIVEAETAMERLLRQYVILRDAEILEDIKRQQTDVVRSLRQLGDLALPVEIRAGVQHVISLETALYGELTSAPDNAVKSTPPPPADLLDRFAKVTAESQQVIDRSEQYVSSQVQRVPQAAEEARMRLIWQLLAAVPVALLIALWFKRAISNQIRQLDRAIRTIGRADRGEGITVMGTPDITYLGRRLEWLRRRLGELEEQKNRFLQHVSHDLKTPLTAMREGAQLLADGVPGGLNEQQKSIVAIISQNTLRLQKLIEDLLNFQHASFAASAIEPQPVAFDVICLNVLRVHRLAAAARGIRFRRELPAVLLDGDADKLRVVVDNLITNAIKFTPTGKQIEIRLQVAGANAILDVIDEGAGVAEDEREKIFDAFFRGTRTQRGERGEIMGSGLGLAIAKEYVQAHRGDIELVPPVKGRTGAHFRVTLPLKWKAE
jgi:two-component system sensor histidine kinase GlrK